MAKKAFVYDGTEWVDIAQSTTDLSNYYTKSQSDAITPPGAWTSWSPTLSGGWANGNGTWEAFYTQIGKTVHVDAAFTIGSTTTKGSTMTITLPVTAKRPGTNVRRIIGSMIGFIGSGFYAMFPYQNTTTTFIAYNISASGSFAQAATVTAATPATWGTGDSIHFSLTYEAA
jgi:hypothetical protein